MSAIGITGDNALLCRSEMSSRSNQGNWYLHPTHMSTDESDRIVNGPDRGWHRNRTWGANYHLVRLWRDHTNTAEEGILTCTFTLDNSTPVSVGIYYPSKLS